MSIKIYNTHKATTEKLYNAIESNGLAIFYGGRLETRRQLGDLQIFIERPGNTSFQAIMTIDHPYCEVGFAFDEDCYSFDKIRRKVMSVFDSYLAEIEYMQLN